jgi:hypothetical protein
MSSNLIGSRSVRGKVTEARITKGRSGHSGHAAIAGWHKSNRICSFGRGRAHKDIDLESVPNSRRFLTLVFAAALPRSGGDWFAVIFQVSNANVSHVRRQGYIGGTAPQEIVDVQEDPAAYSDLISVRTNGVYPGQTQIAHGRRGSPAGATLSPPRRHPSRADIVGDGRHRCTK